MKSFVFVLLLVALAAGFPGFSQLTEEEAAVMEAYPRIKSRAELHEFMRAMEYNMKEARAQPGFYDDLEIKAACPSLPTPPVSNSVHTLRPGNIKIVLAIGDSITAAMSAKDSNVLILREYRGIAWSMGGDKDIITLPNILHNFSVGLTGYSTGIGKRDEYSGNGLNGAVSGSRAQNMSEQVKWLATALAKRTDINPATEWKILSLWIGSNNLCDFCTDAVYNGADAFYTNVRAALQAIYDTIPRVLINIIPLLDVTDLYKFNGLGCSVVHPIACPCGTSSNAENRRNVQLATANYTRRIYQLAQEFNARGSTDKTVVVQPFLINTQIPERRFLSAADCFHPAPIAHENLAVAYWNSLLTPVETKRLQWVPGEQPLCPTSESIIPTCPTNNPSCCNGPAKSLGLC